MKGSPRRVFGTCIAATVICCSMYAAPGAAQQASVPSVQEIIEKLRAPTVNDDALRRNAVAIEGERPQAESPRSIDFDVNFEYGSVRLTPDARIVLDNLAQALADPVLADARIRITGHTDARGGRAVNLRISRQRARAVADYLVQQHGIRAARLTVEGVGFSQLLDPAHPDSPVNRRVQITNLDS